MSVLQIVIFLVLGLLFLVMGGDGLVRGSVAIAKRFGVSPLIIGLTIVSFGTSAPELLVSTKASLDGYGSIAVGNIVGSNIGNIALILGVSAIIFPLSISLQILKKELPIMIIATLVTTLFMLDGYLSRLEGLLFTAGIVAYTYFGYKLSKTTNESIPQESSVTPIKQQSIYLSIAFILGGLGLLVVGGNLFVDGAVAVAKIFNLSEAVIGLTIVAVGTSLPELFTSVIAAIKKESDIAVGNIIGSNVFNLLGILGVASILNPIKSPEISMVDFAVMNALGLLLIPLLKTGFKLNRIEGGLLLVCYALYVGYLLSA